MGHVTRPRYGRDKNTLAELFTFASKVGKLSNGWDVAYFVRAFYDSAYGHAERMYLETYEKKAVNSDNRPLSMVSMNTREGLMEMDGFAKRVSEYDSYNVIGRTGMSLDKWLMLPTFRLESILAGLRHNFQALEKAKEQSRAEQAANNMYKGGDPASKALEQLATGSKYKP